MALSSPPTTLAPKSRVLIIGATGFIGKFLAEASLSAGHPTYLLIRPGGSPISSKSSISKIFQEKGAVIIYGGIDNKEFMEKILKKYEIDVVISAIGADGLLDQITLVQAMKSIKTIKRFLPSEFGHDVDRAEPVEPGLEMYKQKRLVRRALEESGVPYTYVCCNSIASWPYYDNCHPSSLPPPLDKLHVYGNGNIKAYFVDGIDIGKFTMKIVDDDRAINKNIHFRPSINCYNMNELASLWEDKIARKIPRLIVSENDLLAIAAENILPDSIVAALTHDIFINGCQVNYKIDGVHDVEISSLYPGESFRSMEDCFEEFVVMAAEEVRKEENGVAGGAKPIVEPVIITASC